MSSSRTAALLVYLCASLVSAQGEWASWSCGERAGDGAWLWTANDVVGHVGVARVGEGIVKVSVLSRPTQISAPQEAKVEPGSVQVSGLPPMTFQFREGQMRCRLPAANSERLFGLGEKYNSVDQRGKRVNMWVDSGYRSLGDRTYLPVPMYLSSAGYGLYLDSSFRSVFDLASDGKSVIITNHAPEMTLYLWTGENYAKLMRSYCQITGLPEAPPEWAFGIWLSRCSYASQREVLEVARRWRALDLPLSLFNIEGWKGKSYHSFNDKSFPDPRAMIEELHSYGWKVMLWNTHNLPPTDPNYAYGDEHGHFAKGLDGKTYNVPHSYGRGGCLDVTNPEAVKWWDSLYDPLLELGVDALFNDVTNYLDDDLHEQRAGRMTFSNGKTSEEMHNLYWLLFNKITYKYMKNKTGNDTVLRCAGGWAGQQKCSTVWAGDSACTWDFLERDIKALLSMGWSGIPYFGYDIPGFSAKGNPPSAELYIRWVQFGALSPLMQFHTNARPEPWHYGDAAIGALRAYGWLRESFMPYIYSLALEAQETGTPMARSLAWQYPQDEIAARIEDEYLLGSDLLIAPLHKPGTQRRVYIPQGVWMDIADGTCHEGPVWVEAQAPLDHLPIYMREGAIIPMKLDPQLNVAAPMKDRYVKAIEALPPFKTGTQYSVWRRKGAVTNLSCSRRKKDVILRAWGDDLPAGTLLRFEVGPPEKLTVDGKKLTQLSPAEVAAGEKPGYCYRKSEQVCFVSPGEDWREVTLTEEHGQLQFEEWEAPTRIPANARRARIEVTLREMKQGAVPVLSYAYLGSGGTVLGKRTADARWRFDAPLELSAEQEKLIWRVEAVAKTGEKIKSRPRVTVIQTPTRIEAPGAIRLKDAGEFRLKVLSNSSLPTGGRIAVEGPERVAFTPATISYRIRGVGASREIPIRYRIEQPQRGAKPLGLGEHQIMVQHTIGRTKMAGATILAARPFAWQIVGPFGGEGKREDWPKALKIAYGPEKGEVDLAAEYQGAGGKVKWQVYPEEWIGDDGMIDIERLYGKVDLVSAYLYASFEWPVARDVLLKVGSDDALMLWLNGKKVFEFPGGRPADRDQDTITVSLTAGRNTVLAKVFDILDAWRFYFRITDLNGKPLSDFSP